MSIAERRIERHQQMAGRLSCRSHSLYGRVDNENRSRDLRIPRLETLVIEAPEIAQILPATNRFNFILTPTAARVGPALARTSQVTLALGSDDRAGEAELLDRMNTRDFAAGLKSMGLDDEESFRLATRCGRSVTVLSRLNASAIARPPEWHRDSTLVPFVLAGGWTRRTNMIGRQWRSCATPAMRT